MPAPFKATGVVFAKNWRMSLLAMTKHRWHWTLDRSNPDRVSVHEYAREVGEPVHIVRAHAWAYARFLDRAERGVDPRSLMDLVEDELEAMWSDRRTTRDPLYPTAQEVWSDRVDLPASGGQVRDSAVYEQDLPRVRGD